MDVLHLAFSLEYGGKMSIIMSGASAKSARCSGDNDCRTCDMRRLDIIQTVYVAETKYSAAMPTVVNQRRSAIQIESSAQKLFGVALSVL